MHNPVRPGRLSRSENSMLAGLRKRLAAVESINTAIGNIVIDNTSGKARFFDRTTRRFVKKDRVHALDEQRAAVLAECADLYNKLDNNSRTFRRLRALDIPAETFVMMRKCHIEAKRELL